VFSELNDWPGFGYEENNPSKFNPIAFFFFFCQFVLAQLLHFAFVEQYIYANSPINCKLLLTKTIKDSFH